MTRSDEPRIYVIDLDELGRIRPGGQLIRVESIEGLVYLIACSDSRRLNFDILMEGPTSDELIEWIQGQSVPAYCLGRPDGVINGVWISGDPLVRVELGEGAWLVCLGRDGVPREIDDFVRWMREANTDRTILERMIARLGTSFIQAQLRAPPMNQEIPVRPRGSAWANSGLSTPRSSPAAAVMSLPPSTRPVISSLELPSVDLTARPQRRVGIRGVRLGAAIVNEPQEELVRGETIREGGLVTGAYKESSFDTGPMDVGVFEAGDLGESDTLDIGPSTRPVINTAQLSLSPLGTNISDRNNASDEVEEIPETVRPMVPPDIQSSETGRRFVSVLFAAIVIAGLWAVRQPLSALISTSIPDRVDESLGAQDIDVPVGLPDDAPEVNSCAVLAGVEKVESGAFCWRLLKVMAEGESLSVHLREELEAFHVVRSELEREIGESMETYTGGQEPTDEQRLRVYDAWEPVVSALHGRVILEIFLDDWESKATSAKDPYHAATTPLGEGPSDWLNGFSPRVAADEEWAQVFPESVERPVNITKLRNELFPGATSGLREQDRLIRAARIQLGQSDK